MKTIFLKILLIFCVVFVFTVSGNAELYEDPLHPPLSQADTPVSDTAEGSGFISHPFQLGPGSTNVSFSFNMVTREILTAGDGGFDPDLANPSGFMPWVNDYFAAAVFHADTLVPLEFLFMTDINEQVAADAFYPIDGWGTNGPHGSFFTYQTGWMAGSFDIPDTLAGQNVRVGFAVFDLEDEHVDTAVLLGDISLPVPNGDFSGGLLGPSGVIGMDSDGNHLYAGNVHLLPDFSLDGVQCPEFEGNYAYISNGPEDMFPVAHAPEPISSTLFIVGGATLGFRQWRKKRRN